MPDVQAPYTMTAQWYDQGGGVYRSKQIVSEIFIDDFESGDFLAPALNDIAFSWGSITNDVSVQPSVGRGGGYGARFRWPTDTHSAELNYSHDPQSELWMAIDYQVPSNYVKPTNAPANDKFLAVYCDGYSAAGDGSTAVLELWPDGSGNVNLRLLWSEGAYQGGVPELPQVNFINLPADQGKWMTVLVHIKPSTTRTSSDGVLEVFRKWDGESSYTQLLSTATAKFILPTTGYQGLAQGKIMGWANALYAAQTDWIVDNVTRLVSSKHYPKRWRVYIEIWGNIKCIRGF